MNGIHEVTGSIPVWSTIFLFAFANPPLVEIQQLYSAWFVEVFVWKGASPAVGDSQHNAGGGQHADQPRHPGQRIKH